MTVKSDITRFKHSEIVHSVKKVIHGANKITLLSSPNIFGRFYMGPLVSEISEFHIKTYSYLPPLPSNLQFVGGRYDLSSYIKIILGRTYHNVWGRFTYSQSSLAYEEFCIHLSISGEIFSVV